MCYYHLCWRVSEVVVTRRTRNAVIRKDTWVRIPHSPPAVQNVQLFYSLKYVSWDSNPRVPVSLRSTRQLVIIDYSPLWLQTAHRALCFTRRAHTLRQVQPNPNRGLFFFLCGASPRRRICGRWGSRPALLRTLTLVF